MFILKYSDLPESHPALASNPPLDNVAFVHEGDDAPTDGLPWTEVTLKDYNILIAAQSIPEPEPIEPTPDPDWSIVDCLRASPVFARAFAGGNESVPAINASSYVRDAMFFQNVNDLRFGFNQLRVALANTSVGDFTAEELAFIGQKLEEYHFPLEGFNLS